MRNAVQDGQNGDGTNQMRVGLPVIEGYSFTHRPVWLGIEGIARAARQIEELGFDVLLAPEAGGHDPFFPLLIAAEHTTRIQLATGVAVAFPRSPTVVAQMAWDLQRMSAGRFALGLGTQVKGQNERRLATPWTAPPGPRLREYVQCLRAVLRTFQDSEAPTFFTGKHYQFTMMPPIFNPGPIEHPDIPVYVAAVNRYNARLGGELGEGVFAHPICTPKYVREALLPAIEEGARRAGRPPEQVEVLGAPIIVTGRNHEELEAERKLLKRRVAFYGSTRTYHPVLEAHGWGDLGRMLHPMSLEERWADMEALIPDEVAEEFAVIGTIDEIGARLSERWGGILTTVFLPTDYPRATADEERELRKALEALQALQHPTPLT